MEVLKTGVSQLSSIWFGMFHYKTSIYGIPHLRKPPIYVDTSAAEFGAGLRSPQTLVETQILRYSSQLLITLSICVMDILRQSNMASFMRLTEQRQLILAKTWKKAKQNQQHLHLSKQTGRITRTKRKNTEEIHHLIFSDCIANIRNIPSICHSFR